MPLRMVYRRNDPMSLRWPTYRRVLWIIHVCGEGAFGIAARCRGRRRRNQDNTDTNPRRLFPKPETRNLPRPHLNPKLESLSPKTTRP